MRLMPVVAVLWTLAFPFAGQVAAQARPSPAMDVSAGEAWFADDSLIEHGYVGVWPRFYVTPRLSLGPEVVYMVGPGTDRDLFITANVNYEWPLPVGAASPRVTPFVLAGWGYMRHTPRFGTGSDRRTQPWAGAACASGSPTAFPQALSFAWESSCTFASVVRERSTRAMTGPRRRRALEDRGDILCFLRHR